MGHITDIICTIKTVGMLLWVHTKYQPKTMNIKGSCCRLKYFCWIENRLQGIGIHSASGFLSLKWAYDYPRSQRPVMMKTDPNPPKFCTQLTSLDAGRTKVKGTAEHCYGLWNRLRYLHSHSQELWIHTLLTTIHERMRPLWVVWPTLITRILTWDTLFKLFIYTVPMILQISFHSIFISFH